MGKPGVVNIDVYRGDTFTIALRFWADTTPPKQTGIDVSARTFTVDATTTGLVSFDIAGFDIQQVVGGVTTTIVAGSVTVGGEFTHS